MTFEATHFNTFNFKWWISCSVGLYVCKSEWWCRCLASCEPRRMFLCCSNTLLEQIRHFMMKTESSDNHISCFAVNHVMAGEGKPFLKRSLHNHSWENGGSCLVGRAREVPPPVGVLAGRLGKMGCLSLTSNRGGTWVSINSPLRQGHGALRGW